MSSQKGQSGRKKKNVFSESSEEEEHEVEREQGSRKKQSVSSQKGKSVSSNKGKKKVPDPERKRIGSNVVAVFEGQWFIAAVVDDQEGVQSGYTKLSYMTIKGPNSFAWSDRADVMITLNEDIILSDVEVLPVPGNSRGHMCLNKNDFKRMTNWMVVVYKFLNLVFQIEIGIGWEVGNRNRKKR